MPRSVYGHCCHAISTKSSGFGCFWSGDAAAQTAVREVESEFEVGCVGSTTLTADHKLLTLLVLTQGIKR